MKQELIAIIILSTLTGVASADMLEWEVTPVKAAEHKWDVATTGTGHATTFTFSIPFNGGALPEGTSATLEVLDGKKLVSRSTLRLQSEGGRTYFRFTVGNDFLADSKFSLTKIDSPHPSGVTYWANLKKFAEPRREGP